MNLKLLDRPIWRLVIYVAGVIFAAGVFYASARSTDAEQGRIVSQHSRQIDDLSANTLSNAKAIGELRGAIADQLRAFQAEHEMRIREADKMDERIRYLERHR